MSELSASQTMFEEMKARVLVEQFRHDPDAILERVATHYASLAYTALSLKAVLETKRQIGADENTQHFIESIRKQIVDAHVGTFGVPPSWDTLEKTLRSSKPPLS